MPYQASIDCTFFSSCAAFSSEPAATPFPFLSGLILMFLMNSANSIEIAPIGAPMMNTGWRLRTYAWTTAGIWSAARAV